MNSVIMKFPGIRLTNLKDVLFFCLTLIIISSSAAQEKDGEVEDAEVLIIKDRQITLPKIEKRFEKIKIPDNNSEHYVRPNIFNSYQFKLQKSIPSIKVAGPNNQDDIKLFKNYVKAGLGNFGSALIKAGLNIPTDKNKVLGINLDHLSFAKGAKDGKNSASSTSGVGVYGKLIGEKATLSSTVKFRSQTEYFYGYDNSLEVDRNTIKQNFNRFYANIELGDAFKKDLWDYEIALNFKSISDNFSVSESMVMTTSKLSYDQKVSLKVNAQTSSFENLTSINRGLIRINPHYHLEVGEVMMKVGFSYNTQNDTVSAISKSKVFPYLSAAHNISKNLQAYATLDGGFDFNSFGEIVDRNPFVSNALLVQNSENKYDFEIGLKGNPTNKLDFDLSLEVLSVKNMGFFNNSILDTTKFILSYLDISTKVLRFITAVNYKLNNSNVLGLNFEYSNYSNELDFRPHVPTLNIELKGEHTIFPKFKVNWNFKSLSGIKVVVPISGEERGFSIQNLQLGGQYHVNKQFHAFINLDNILNQKYERYLFYEQRGIQFKGGIFYKF